LLGLAAGDEALADVLLDPLELALGRRPVPAAARGDDADRVALLQVHVRELAVARDAEGGPERPEAITAVRRDEDRRVLARLPAEEAPGPDLLLLDEARG